MADVGLSRAVPVSSDLLERLRSKLESRDQEPEEVVEVGLDLLEEGCAYREIAQALLEGAQQKLWPRKVIGLFQIEVDRYLCLQQATART